jgi:hypothetical protein
MGTARGPLGLFFGLGGLAKLLTQTTQLSVAPTPTQAKHGTGVAVQPEHQVDVDDLAHLLQQQVTDTASKA